MSDFYVTLPSHSSKSEFPDNKANHFKIRLPQPMRLNGSGGWKVGMSSISMPDAHVSLPSFTKSEDKTILSFSAWRRIDSSSYQQYGEAYFDTDDLKEVFYNVDGVGFMKSMIAYFHRQRVFKNNGPKLGSKYVNGDGKRTYVKLKWEGEDLVTDNKGTLRPITRFPALHVNVELALKMGWLKKTGNSYELGPNLQIEFFDDVVSDISVVGDVHDTDGAPVFWIVESDKGGNGDFLRLSIYCNWRFLNLNKAFEVVVGNSSRSLFVYSDVGGSSVVGNQVTDLLREVNLIRRGSGVQYFEPYHIQYIPVRKDVLDIIEVQVAETTGELTTFGEGNTIVTLHFKKE